MAKFDIVNKTEATVESSDGSHSPGLLPSPPAASDDPRDSMEQLLMLTNKDRDARDSDYADASAAQITTSGAEMDILNLKSFESTRSEAMQLTIQIMQGQKSIVDKILGGDEHGSSSDGSGSSGGDHPPGWPFTATASDVHHAGAGVAGDALSAAEILEYCASQINERDQKINQSMDQMKEHLDHGNSNDAELDMLNLQSLVSGRQEVVQLTTQIVQGLNDAEKSIVNNIGGGGGNGSSGGDHPPGWPFTSTVSDVNHGSVLHDGITDKTSDATLVFHENNLTAHTETVATVHLPDLAAPDLKGFLTENGIDVGNHGSDGPLGQINLGGSDDNQGPISGLPNPTGGNNSTDIPGDLDLNHGGLGVPKGVDLGNDGPLTGLGVPKRIDIDNNDITGVGVPGEIDNHGGISGPGVPGGSGHVGDGGFKPSDFDTGHLTDAPDDGGGGYSFWSPVSSSLSHGDIYGAAMGAADALQNQGSAYGTSSGEWGRNMLGAAEYAAGSIVYVEAASISGTLSLISLGATAVVNAVAPDETQTKDDTPPPPKPDDPNKGNQPVDDSGTGAHPSTHGTEQPVDDSGTSPAHPGTHGAEQPVDDSGTGPVHPLTGMTAQPVDDSGTSPAHPGTHLGAVAVDAPSLGSANLAAESFGGHSAAFWDAAAHSIADSQHATAATANASVDDASAPVAHNDSLGIFQHSASTSFAASTPVADSQANMDALATTHLESSHAETEPSHSSLGAGLDLSHLALHM